MSNWTPVDLKRQLDAARKPDTNGHAMFHLLQVAADARGLPFAFLLAIASRETGIRNVAGDSGHGRSILQIDDRSHADFITRHPSFTREPDAYIDYGVVMLIDNVFWARRRWPKYDSYKIAAAAYNAGRGGAAAGVALGDCDKRTTGGDYGDDVRHRQRVFEELLDQ